MIYSECVEAFSVRICCVLYRSQGQKQAVFFLARNLRPVLESVGFVVRRSLKPFKDFYGHFDPSSTALSERAQTRRARKNRRPVVRDK